MRNFSALSILVLTLSANIPALAELAGGLVDPTRPLDYVAGTGESAQTNLVLTSVMIMGNTRTAVINGERVEERQRVGGAEVISIRPGRVILRQGGHRQELKVHSGGVKKSPGDQ